MCRARRDIALELLAHAPDTLGKGILGTALPLADRGLNVRVFADHVAEAASRNQRPYATVLAHAIAHECGHILLKTAAHEGFGLMANVWKEHEFDSLKFGRGMFFTHLQAQRMEATLRGEGCHSVSPALTPVAAARTEP
jgi:hypothetical protein